MNKYGLLIMAAVTMLVFFGCEDPNLPPPGDTIPVESIKWETDGEGFYQYSTNDVADQNKTARLVFSSTIAEDPMTTVTAEIKKLSGLDYYSFGMIFGWQDWDNFYEMAITNDGWYTIWVQVSDVWTEVIDWTESSFLNIGAGSSNTISVTYNTPDIDLKINGNDETSIAPAVFNSGSAGFMIFIGEDENFPEEPIDVRFKMTSPVSLP